MNIEQTRYMISQTRQHLSGLYEQKDYFKRVKHHCDESGNIAFEYLAHNSIKKLSKEIAKLVTIQKALKADVRNLLAAERSRRDAVVTFASKLAAQ